LRSFQAPLPPSNLRKIFSPFHLRVDLMCWNCLSLS
jgi:hypothetical protein